MSRARPMRAGRARWLLSALAALVLLYFGTLCVARFSTGASDWLTKALFRDAPEDTRR